MYNFISEEERREELYGVYSKRHEEVLNTFKKITTSYSDDYFILTLLSNSGVNKREIEWLKRTQHYMPKI